MEPTQKDDSNEMSDTKKEPESNLKKPENSDSENSDNGIIFMGFN